MSDLAAVNRTKSRIVLENIAKCKEYIAAILIQIITLYYDNTFMSLCRKYFKGDAASKWNHKKFKSKIHGKIMQENPFQNAKLNDNILVVAFNFLIEDQTISGIYLQSKKMRDLIQVAFHYITTVDLDPFINSLK